MNWRLLSSLTLATAALAPVAVADAAKPAPYPSVSKITPLDLGIGDTMTITGKNFVAGANKNTVVFKRDGKRAVFVKAHASTKTSLKVVIPEKLRAVLSKKAGAEVPTKFRIRILSRRFAKTYTDLKASPRVSPQTLVAKPDPAVIKLQAAEAAAAAAAAAGKAAGAADGKPAPPPDCDRDGTVDALDPEDDADGLSDVDETDIGTDRCNVDTDGDGLEDGWEYKSAFDLNRESCPDNPYPVPCQSAVPAKYPKKKPYPNPLDGTDAQTDHDGDWMPASAEHHAWKLRGSRDLSKPLYYSDGLQASIHDGHTTECRGMRVPVPIGGIGPEFQVYSLDRIGTHAYDGCLDDAERDEDNDLLTNVEELSDELENAQFWVDLYKEPMYRVEFAGTDWMDDDSDADGILDGKDDQDHDDFWNLEEVTRGVEIINKDGDYTGRHDGLWVDPFNPCLPSIRSRTCPPQYPVSGAVWRPFWREGDPPKPRWPLYDSEPVAPSTPPPPARPITTKRLYWHEEWRQLPLASQTMPAQHPLPRCIGITETC